MSTAIPVVGGNNTMFSTSIEVIRHTGSDRREERTTITTALDPEWEETCGDASEHLAALLDIGHTVNCLIWQTNAGRYLSDLATDAWEAGDADDVLAALRRVQATLELYVEGEREGRTYAGSLSEHLDGPDTALVGDVRLGWTEIDAYLDDCGASGVP